MPLAAPLTFTLDLEQHRADGANTRYLDNAERILDFLAARAVRATVFAVGELVAGAPALMRRAHAGGHELALHSHAHLPLTEDRPSAFQRCLADCRARLEDVIGARVSGFRAPVFSLTPATTWVTPILAELGFSYSSSVLPARHPLFGFPGAPPTPFRWPVGLLELPVPLARSAGLALPFLGGIYLRYLPRALVAHWRRRLAPGVVPWSYVHPYDIDADEDYYRFPGTSPAMSWLLWRRRGVTLGRLAALIDDAGGAASPPFAELVARGSAALIQKCRAQ